MHWPVADPETAYEALAEQLDAIAKDKRALSLAKLVLLVSHDLDDSSQALSRLREPAANIDVWQPSGHFRATAGPCRVTCLNGGHWLGW